MQTSAGNLPPLRISHFVPSKRGLNLSNVRLDSFGLCLSSSSQGDGVKCSSFFKEKCYGMPQSELPALFSDHWSSPGKSSTRARRLNLMALEGQTSFASIAEEPATPCDDCNGRGWLSCDFCEGQKVNVQAKNNRVYRRCPLCRTAGVVICPRCKVFKCISYPDEADIGIAL